MQYALLIYEDESHYDDEAAMLDIIAKHEAFSVANGDVIRGGAGLQNTPSATTIRTAGGQSVLHDGPFAEIKEQLGGFYLIEVDDLDAAIAVARQIPLAGDGSVEIRPLIPMDDGTA